MKICIVTITNGSNFGNRLQNFALQEILRQRYDFEVSTLRNISGEAGSRFLKYKPIRCLLENSLIMSLLTKTMHRPRLGKKMQFVKFNNDHIRWEEMIAESDNVPVSIVNEYDYFISGSDQVWNTAFPFISSVEFLGFVPPAKRIAYAASFGSGKFDEYEKTILEKNISFLKEYKAISVREASSNEVLLKYGIDNAEVLIDPTLLIGSDQWEKIELRPAFLENDDYILTYFLNDFNLTDEVKCYNGKRDEFVNSLAKKKNLKIVNINYPEKYDEYAIGPAEFLYLIHHAKYVCTNSFHATVFSIIFNKNFSAYKRDGSRNRIDSLLKKLSINQPYENQEMSGIDYCVVESIIAKERENAFAYLDKAFEL